LIWRLEKGGLNMRVFRLGAAIAAICIALPATAQEKGPEKLDAVSLNGTADVVGTYRLTGVMETASELKLSPNGRYGWWLVVGGLDLYSEGEWTRSGDAVTLGPHQFDKNLTAFALADWRPWQTEDSKAAEDIEAIRLKNRARRTCPFLGAGGHWGVEDPELPTLLPPGERYAEAVKIEAKMKAAYQAAIVAFFAPGGTRDDDDLEIDARTAKGHWEMAADFLREVALASGQSAIITPPDLPADCSPPVAADNKAAAKPDWPKGYAVWIGKRGQPQWNRHVDVTFNFADGSSVKGDSYELGFVAVPDDGRKLSAISMSLTHNGQIYESRYDITKSKEMESAKVFYAWPDPRMLINPPFEAGTLTVSDGRLIPKSFLNIDGAYILTSVGE
jgi:hypothetical protein